MAGDDTIRVDESSAVFTDTEIGAYFGGSGTDQILGGAGRELLAPGSGGDFVDGNRGNDLALLGADDDRFQWDPGDGSDVVQGEGGLDAMVFNGAAAAESFQTSANGSRIRFLRDLGNIVMDLDDVESILLNTLAGADNVVVNDVSGTDLVSQENNLEGTPGSTTGDSERDTLTVRGTGGNDQVSVTGDATSSRVTGLAAEVLIAGADPASDQLTVNTVVGDDTIDASLLAADAVAFVGDGGNGNDTILGGAGVESLFGDAGADVIDGGRGNDIARLGKGDDRFQWDPGEGSDVVEGQDGFDTMTFNGAPAPERFDTSANGGRVRFFRDVGNITMDVDGVEQIDLEALGGADGVVVGDMTGTDLVRQTNDLEGEIGNGLGDGQADTVTVKGTEGPDAVTVTGAAGTADVSGLAANVTIATAEPGIDRLTVETLGGDDTVDASLLGADTIQLSVDAGADDDTVLGGAGPEIVLGGDGDDFVDGGRANDVAFLGAGADRFQWDPGEGSDVVEGQDGDDAMTFNGAPAAERFRTSPNGGRVLFLRDLGNIVMDLDDVEQIDLATLGGVDDVIVDDMTGTDLVRQENDLEDVAGTGTGDGAADTVTVTGTNGDDTVTVSGADGVVDVAGLVTAVRITAAEAIDALTVDTLAGTDAVDSTGLVPGTILLNVP